MVKSILNAFLAYKSRKYFIAVILLLVCTMPLRSFPVVGRTTFFDWFENKSLRIDYFLAGNRDKQNFYLDEIKEEPYWSGSFSSTIDQLGFGTHRVEVTDKETGTLIFSMGFCTLFQEWQTINEAKSLSRAFEQVTRIPFPKNSVSIKFMFRERETGNFANLYQMDIDPSSLFISKIPALEFPVNKIIYNGNPNEKLDIVFIAEGYTIDQMGKFRSNVSSLAHYLFSQKPFVDLQEEINIWAIESPSTDQGPSNPGLEKWNRTPAQTTFYTFGIDRYLTTTKYKRVMDIAANAPGDIIYILVNSEEYGGGGIYNHYNVTTSDHSHSKIVFIHELGHGLVGLGDEYYTSDVAYQNFYPLHIEPWEPNLTTLVEFKSKWLDMLDVSTPIPTPLDTEYKTKIGVFEGGGYMLNKVYRPSYDCRMKSNTASSFCPVCQRAIERVVQTYLK